MSAIRVCAQNDYIITYHFLSPNVWPVRNYPKHKFRIEMANINPLLLGRQRASWLLCFYWRYIDNWRGQLEISRRD